MGRPGSPCRRTAAKSTPERDGRTYASATAFVSVIVWTCRVNNGSSRARRATWTRTSASTIACGATCACGRRRASTPGRCWRRWQRSHRGGSRSARGCGRACPFPARTSSTSAALRCGRYARPRAFPPRPMNPPPRQARTRLWPRHRSRPRQRPLPSLCLSLSWTRAARRSCSRCRSTCTRGRSSTIWSLPPPLRAGPWRRCSRHTGSCSSAARPRHAAAGTFLLRFGMWWLDTTASTRCACTTASSCRSRCERRPLALVPGLPADPRVDEVVLFCRRAAP